MGTTENFEQMGIEDSKLNENGCFGKTRQGLSLIMAGLRMQSKAVWPRKDTVFLGKQ